MSLNNFKVLIFINTKFQFIFLKQIHVILPGKDGEFRLLLLWMGSNSCSLEWVYQLKQTNKQTNKQRLFLYFYSNTRLLFCCCNELVNFDSKTEWTGLKW